MRLTWESDTLYDEFGRALGYVREESGCTWRAVDERHPFLAFAHTRRGAMRLLRQHAMRVKPDTREPVWAPNTLPEEPDK